MGISYDVDDGDDAGEVIGNIPPAPVSIPQAPKSLLDGGSIQPPAQPTASTGDILSGLGSILDSAWTRGSSDDEIVGQWAENGSPYIIKVPSQLREPILSMQNMLQSKYDAIKAMKRKLAELERGFLSIFG